MGIETGFFIGAIILGLGLAYGTYQYSRRNRANDPVTDAATRESYKDPEGYAQGKEREFRKEVKPS